MAKVYPYKEEGTPLSFLHTCSTETLIQEIASRSQQQGFVIGYVAPNEQGKAQWHINAVGEPESCYVLSLRLQAWLHRCLGL